MNLTAHTNEWIMVAFVLAIISFFLNKVMARFFKDVENDHKRDGLLKLASLISSLSFFGAIIIIALALFGGNLSK